MPIITYGKNSYTAIYGTGQVLAKTIHLRMGVFHCPHITPLPKLNAAYFDFSYANAPMDSADYRRFGHIK